MGKWFRRDNEVSEEEIVVPDPEHRLAGWLGMAVEAAHHTGIELDVSTSGTELRVKVSGPRSSRKEFKKQLEGITSDVD